MVLSKTGRFLSKAAILAVLGVFSPLSTKFWICSTFGLTLGNFLAYSGRHRSSAGARPTSLEHNTGLGVPGIFLVRLALNVGQGLATRKLATKRRLHV